MTKHTPIPQPRTMEPRSLSLRSGRQAFINGALLTALSDCSFELAQPGCLITDEVPTFPPTRHPVEELYFSLLETRHDPQRFAAQQMRIHHLLAQAMHCDADPNFQSQCRTCAAALFVGDLGQAAEAAALMAQLRLGDG